MFGPGTARRVVELLAGSSGGHVLVRGRRSFSQSGAGEILAAVQDQSVVDVEVATGLPDFDLAERLGDELGQRRPAVVVAVGGGLIIDTAKTIIMAAANSDLRSRVIGSQSLEPPVVGLIAVPTTSGSGSERTPFSVSYINGSKYSIYHEDLRPDYAVVDPRLTDSMPGPLTAVTGLDAMSHAMESLWSTAATGESREISLRALDLCWSNLPKAANDPFEPVRDKMAMASTLAGEAIATTRTTLAHALSYYLTSAYGIPHGHAVALTLPKVLAFNANSELAPTARTAIESAYRVIGVKSGPEADEAITSMVAGLGLATRLSDLDITTEAERDAIASNVNVERLGNNPAVPSPTDLRRIVEAIA